MKNKNILLVISKFPPEYSGPGVRIPRLYKWFEEKGYDFKVNVICNGIEQIKNEEYVIDGLPVRRITAETLNKLFLLLKFIPKRVSHSLIYQAEFLKTFFILTLSKKYQNIDFLHVAGHSGGTAAALVWAKIRKIPVLMELVNAQAKPYQKFLFFFNITAYKKGKIAFLTKYNAHYYKKLGLEDSKIWIKPNPVDANKFFIEESKKNNFREQKTFFSNEDIVICSVAKLIPRKNQKLLIEVLDYLPDQYKLIIAGPAIEKGPNFQRDQKYYLDMISSIKEKSLEKRIYIKNGYVEPEILMKASDIYVMPAWDEGLGTTMLEAMACGLPVVANQDEPAFKEWVENGHNGYLADIMDPKQWAECILNASKIDKETRREISRNIHSKVSKEKIFSEYEEIFKNFL